MQPVTEAEKIPVAEFLKRNPRFKSTAVKAWCYGHRARLLDEGIAGIYGHCLRVDEARLVAWLDEHGEAPKPVRKVGGLNVAALDGGRPPRVLAVLQEGVPQHGRPLSIFERHELIDWGVVSARSPLRTAPTATQGEFSLWKVRRRQVTRLPHLVTFAGRISGTWTTAHDLPTEPPPRIRRKNPKA
jgi:hypothetical protein